MSPITSLKIRLLWKFGYQVEAARAMGVKVGQGCRIYTRNFGSEPWLITIGNRVTVATEVIFVTHDGATWLVRDEKGRRFRFSPVEIGDDVFVGVRSIIMPGVRIGNRCIVGAGSVVNKSVPSGFVVAGVPARIIGQFDDFEERALRTFISEAEMVGKNLKDRVQMAPLKTASEMAPPPIGTSK
jgi:acetyltransferase-like isoleucine patch superfamily enzyme